jgi:aminoglycoside 6'-N-acetyltransferase
VAVTFVPVVESHRALLLAWLSSPHAKDWWGDPQIGVNEILTPDIHQPYIACINDVPLAYVQSYRPSTEPDYPWQHGLSPTTRGIDVTIGEPENLGKGFGSMILKHFAAKLFSEGATRLVIDPDKENARAIACYLKAGFLPYDEYEGSLLMELTPEDFDYGAGYQQ